MKTLDKPSITCIEDFQEDGALRAEIFNLAAPSYINAVSVLEREYKNNRIIYLAREGAMLIAFFMVDFHKIGDVDFYYLGLSACNNEYKGHGVTSFLYLEFARDCIKKELELNMRIMCYWTTATPIAYRWFNAHFINTQPDIEGNCTIESIQILNNIVLAQYPDIDVDISSPFILRRAAHNTTYSNEERARINKAAVDLNLTVFDKYHLDETQGDRFLMIGYAPPLDSPDEY